jgi:putative ABC transport system permease protein
MVKNYLLIALRFMAKQRGFSVINILGLTIGIACSLLILLYIQDEVTFDQSYQKSENIYRVAFDGKIQNQAINSALSAFPLAGHLRKNSSSVEDATRFVKWATFPVHYEGKSFTEKYLLLADRNFLNFFSIPLIEGNPDSVLLGGRKVVLSIAAAERYFNYKGKGDRTPIGKTLELAQGYTTTVVGIAENPVINSHFHYSVILSLDSWDVAQVDEWSTIQAYTYLRKKPDAEIEKLEIEINDLFNLALNKQLESSPELRKQKNSYSYSLQPLRKIHLHSQRTDEIEQNGSFEYILLFSSIAAFITLLACINFMNLTTAQSANRAKEIAVRKSVGAQNNRLILQFLLESYIYVIIGVLFALFVLLVSIQPFNYFTNKQLEFSSLLTSEFIGGLAIFIVLTGLIAGSYPSFYLTQYSPIEVLKGNLRASLRTYGIRNILVVFQFFISTTLIIATMIVYEQLGYIQKINLGFNKENIINLLHTRNLGAKGAAFKKELVSYDEIISASYCNRLPPNVDWQSSFRLENTKKELLMSVYEMDFDHLATMGYPIVDGRFFLKEVPEDTLKIILNEEAAKQLGIVDFSDQKIFSGYDQPSGRIRQIIGVMKNFNFQSLRKPIEPLAIIVGNQPNWEMAIRIKPGTYEQSVATLEKLWKKYVPEAPFEHTLLTQNFEQKIQTEKKIGMLFIIFTVLAIFIGCLGLFGLAAFTAEQQRKAIGIRKVLGATIPEIARMLNKDFLKLVIIANLISWPVTWWIMKQWLSQFAYHISPSWYTFAIAGLTTVAIAFVSVSFQALRAATGNPVNSLRNE